MKANFSVLTSSLISTEFPSSITLCGEYFIPNFVKISGFGKWISRNPASLLSWQFGVMMKGVERERKGSEKRESRDRLPIYIGGNQRSDCESERSTFAT